ncbi:uncharacterized protein UTRI_00903_B [Ustilago trichophora]|uniref:Uncharacterized protein n=1 Tax=Ustilago trichophora TaxID=86804 RepID=A0A5C3DTL5_9BASI|nr:uncharacterized protein UTRI_00903_B [Ustilago trichophora]
MTDPGVQFEWRRHVEAYGSNIFGQLGPEPSNPQNQFQPFILQDADRILAVCTYQTVYMTRSGQMKAIGQCADLLNQALSFHAHPGSPQTNDHLVFVGYDMFEAVLDEKQGSMTSIEYHESLISTLECDHGQRWKAAAVDGRGRWMAIDDVGSVYLFDSVKAFRIATGTSDEAVHLLDGGRFDAYKWHEDESLTAMDDRFGEIRFRQVAAGDAHFVLFAEGIDPTAPALWLFGDARFGAVPAEPFSGTDLVFKVRRQPTALTAMDVPFLMPLPHFSRPTFQHYPSSSGISFAVGSRHTLVVTGNNEMYGWGWNEDAPLLPFASHSAVEAESRQQIGDSIVSRPIRVGVGLAETAQISDKSLQVFASNGRSFVLAGGRLAVAGSNEFGCLALAPGLQGLEKKPKSERELSQIKKTYECVNGFRWHPRFDGRERQVEAVHATSLATFFTVKERVPVTIDE